MGTLFHHPNIWFQTQCHIPVQLCLHSHTSSKSEKGVGEAERQQEGAWPFGQLFKLFS